MKEYLVTVWREEKSTPVMSPEYLVVSDRCDESTPPEETLWHWLDEAKCGTRITVHEIGAKVIDWTKEPI